MRYILADGLPRAKSTNQEITNSQRHKVTHIERNIWTPSIRSNPPFSLDQVVHHLLKFSESPKMKSPQPLSTTSSSVSLSSAIYLFFFLTFPMLPLLPLNTSKKSLALSSFFPPLKTDIFLRLFFLRLSKSSSLSLSSYFTYF